MSFLPAGTLLLASGAVFWAVCRATRAPRGTRVRHALVLTGTLLALLVFIITEGLSAFHALGRTGLSACWSVVALAALVFGARVSRPPLDSQRANRRGARGIALAAATATLLLVLLAVGLVAAPNNFDSMTYHLPRVMHWLQNGSVAHYPTTATRQNMLPPLAEFMLAHVVALTGSDRFVHVVQWAALVGCVTAGSLTARQFGCGAWGQALAGLFAATLPMAVLQATSTKNDLVAAFFLLSALYYAGQLHRNGAPRVGYESVEKGDWLRARPHFRPRKHALARCLSPFSTDRYAVLLGVSLGLGLLTKTSLYLYLLPLCVFVVLQSWARAGLTRAAGQIGLPLVVLVLGLNAPHWARNGATFGAPMPACGATNETPHPVALLSVALRNVGLHLFRTSLPTGWLLPHGFERLHAWAGLDLNDPRTTWPGSAFHIPRWPSRHEDFAGSPLHGVLLVVGLFMLVRYRLLRGWVGAYAGCVLAAALLFCLVLKWQPWHARLQVPLFLAGAPLIALAIDWRSGPTARAVVASVLFVAAVPYVLFNESRPFLGPHSVFVSPRNLQYFHNRPEIAPSYLAAIDGIKTLRPRSVRLVLREDSYEYPLWPLLHAACDPPPRLERVVFGNGGLPDGAAMFDVLFCATEEGAAVLARENWRLIGAYGNQERTWVYVPSAATGATAFHADRR